ncbi:guanylate kinase [Agathobacter sp.]
MGRIFCVMGKSASGKDTIYNKILQDDSLHLSRIIPYTTRPIRDGETDGADYNFCTEDDVKRLTDEGRIIELREYNTVYGVWKYFTVNDENIDLERRDYLTVGTLESYIKIRDYFGKDKVLPIYIEVEDGDRLIRAIHREKQQQVPKYEEMCRRFLADAADFSEDKLTNAGIEHRFVNADMDTVIREISDYIRCCSHHTV